MALLSKEAAHIPPSSTASGCQWVPWDQLGLSTSLSAEHREAPCQGGAGAATSVLPPHGPGGLFCSKTRAVLELALPGLCHPVHHPGSAVGPTVAGDGVHSSFIFTCLLPYPREEGLSLLE